MTTHSIVIPDIGNDEVRVIELLVKAGDAIQIDQGIITLESDKASMDVPSEYTGVIDSLNINVGDLVKTGDVIGQIKSADNNQKTSEKSNQEKTNQPISEQITENATDLVVLGAGPGGYSAAFRAADLGLKVTLIERYKTLGGVCLNVGCIPSKALLHVSEVMESAKELNKSGVNFGEASIDLDKLRNHKSKIINKLTGGLSAMAKMRNISVINGVAQILNNHQIKVKTDEKEQVIIFKNIIIAAGSQSIKLPFLPEDPRIIDSTGALELADIPTKMLVIGGGIIGLEMATVYASLGSQIDIVEMSENLMAGADKDLVKVWQKRNQAKFNQIMLNTKTTKAIAKDDGIYVDFEGKNAPNESIRYDKVLVAVGRSPNGHKIGAELAGIEIDERGFIKVDKQMRTNQPNVFAIGDIVGQPMLAHKAVHEAHVAAEVISGEKAYFDARVIPSVAYTSPEVAWVGITEMQAQKENIKIKKSVFPWSASGRAIANECEDGFTKLIIDDNNKIVGGAIVGPNAGDMIGEIALAIEMNADVTDIALTIHPHPTLGESIGMAAEVAKGVCTDLPPQKKKS